jgi:hypothetical protein
MRLDTLALLSLLLCAGCGGRLGDGERRADGDVSVDDDRIAVLRARCATPWENAFGSGAESNAALLEGRWFRCPNDAATATPRAFVATFDALELSGDGMFYRLVVEANGFVRRADGLGESGTWQRGRDGRLIFTLPPCSAGYVTAGNVSKCGGLDVVEPMFEMTPTRMRFYGEPYAYVKDE